MIDLASIESLVEAVTPKAVELRRILHRHPEPANQEFQTTALIAASLDESGLAYRGRKPETGLWVDVGPEPTVALRADIDALPIQEPADNVPVSQVPGWMHACGHDAHAAIAYGVAVVISRLGVRQGARFLFQPAEEAFPGGAADLVAEGLVDGLKALFAFHVDPTLPVGRIGSRVGPITASADKVTLVLEGPGGHTARPHRTVDLIAAAGRLVHELPEELRQAIDPASALSVAFGAIHGGEAGNVIPTTVELRGTVRTLDEDLWPILPGLVDKAIASLVGPSGAGYSLSYEQAIAPVVNDRQVVETVSAAVEAGLGPGTVVGTPQSMGGEDFSSYLTRVPGALFRLGCGGPGEDLHSPGFRLDEATIGFGIRAGVVGVLALSGEA